MLNILLCNDDGIHAKGLKILFEVLSEIANVTVVAPSVERSTTGQTLTLDHPVRVEKISENFFATSGFPADCALMGILHIMKSRPDLLISGINKGANLGQDIYYSGTVAAARQGAFHQIPSIAVSTVIDQHKINDDDIHYLSAALFVKKIIINGVYKNLKKFEILNINVPNLASCEILGQSLSSLSRRIYSEEIEKRLDSKNREYFWLGGKFIGYEGDETTDNAIVESKKISITLLNLLMNSTNVSNKWHDIINEV